MIDDTQIPTIDEAQEVIAEAQAPEEEQQVTPEAPQEQPRPQAPQESEGERNFRMLRQEKARIERERDEMQRKLKELESKAETEDIAVGDDDIVEGRHLTKTVKELRKLKEEVRQYKEQTAQMSVEARLKNTYTDLDQVLTPDNIAKLSSQYPELAASIDATPDLYNKAAAAYTLIKKFGLSESDPYMEDKIRAQTNAAKPRPLASVSPQQGGSPLEQANAFANGLTPELKAQLFKEMQSAIQNHN